MGIKTQKVLRLISKIILLIVGIALVGYVGLVAYKSIVNKPQRVRITNVTDSAATITWVTDSPVRGVVYYKAKDSVFAGPFGFLFSSVGYDDRDFAVAQEDCVNAFNENAKNTKDENFAVSGENFDCENIRVEKLGSYYTHSVTIKNLDEGSTYFFKVGNGIWSWGINGVGKNVSEDELPLATQFSFVTGVVPESVPTPNIAYGTVFAGSKTEEGYLTEALSKDSLVFAYLTKDGTNSQLISAVTNTDGGWVLDKSNLRDTEGKLISDLTGAAMQFCAQYEDVAFRGCVEITDGLDQDTTVDLLGNVFNDLTIYEKSWILQKFEDLVGKVYASAPDKDCASLTSVEKKGEYSCYKDCDGKVASGCVPGSRWMAKCTWVQKTSITTFTSTTKDWVKFGLIGDNEFPPVCGCTPGTKENNPDGSCTHKECLSGHYWSGWKDGKANGASCGATNPCKGKADDSSCGSNKICKDEVCVDKEENTDPCEGKPDGKLCGNNKICDGGHCVDEENNNGNEENEITTELCNDNQTKVGWCTTGSMKCTSNGGVLQVDATCKCTATDGSKVLIGGCIGTTQHTCEVNSTNGTLIKSEGINSTCPALNETEEKCEIVADYNNRGDLSSCNMSCGDSTINVGKDKCLSLTEGNDEIVPSTGAGYATTRTVDILVTKINIEALAANPVRLQKILEDSEGLKNVIKAEIDKMEKDASNTVSNTDKFSRYCEAAGGVMKNVYPYSCDFSSSQNLNILGMSKVYAEDATTSSYTLYLPEYGMYSFELGDYTVSTQVADGNTIYMFYVEANGTAGFQMPADPDNPTSTEDIVINSGASKITYTKKSVAQKYDIEKGINIVSFNFVPVATTLGAYTAKDIIAQGKNDGVTIKYISTFDGGRWNSGYSCLEGACTGNNFTIVPGKGYLIYATTEGKITIPGYNLTSSVPVPFSAGWNLVGIHGYTTAYTAQSLITSINKVQGLTANNVSWWPTSKSKYEGLQVDGETTYGLDFPISPTNGYFVRIAQFAPTDVKCKSLIWQASGKLNGVCGNTK